MFSFKQIAESVLVLTQIALENLKSLIDLKNVPGNHYLPKISDEDQMKV